VLISSYRRTSTDRTLKTRSPRHLTNQLLRPQTNLWHRTLILSSHLASLISILRWPQTQSKRQTNSPLQPPRVSGAGLSISERGKGCLPGDLCLLTLSLARVYTSLTGKKLTGSAAIRQAREDAFSLGHPSRIARGELREVEHPLIPFTDIDSENDLSPCELRAFLANSSLCLGISSINFGELLEERSRDTVPVANRVLAHR
jgi:hypothetical protein